MPRVDSKSICGSPFLTKPQPHSQEAPDLVQTTLKQRNVVGYQPIGRQMGRMDHNIVRISMIPRQATAGMILSCWNRRVYFRNISAVSMQS